MKLVFEFELNGVSRSISSVTELREEMKRVRKAFQDTSNTDKDFAELQKTLGALKAINKGITDDTRRQQRQFEITTKFAKGSYRQLNAQLVQLRDQYKNLGAAERKAGIGKSIIKDINRLDKELKELDAGIGQYQRNIGNYASAFKGLGGILKSGLIVGAAVEAGKAAARTAADFFKLSTETDTLARKNLVVLGDAYDDVNEKARETAASLGLTTQEYVNQTTAISDILKPIGFLDTEAAELSTQLVDLSGALSEWSGGQKSAEEAAGSLSKALVGEREELKQYGIVLKESDINARLAAKGLDNLTGNAEKQAKAVATLELIMESSTDAQTAFEENSDSMVRTQSRLIAIYNEVRDQIAKALIPVFGTLLKAAEPVVIFFASQIPRAIEVLRTTFGPLFAAFGNLASAIRDSASNATGFAEVANNLAKGALRFLANLLTTIVNGIASLIRTIGTARDETGKFRQDVGFLTRAFVTVIETISKIPAFLNGVLEVVKNSGSIIQTFFRDIVLSTKIAFAELEGVVNQAAKGRAAVLRAQRDELREGGVSIAEAFTNGFNDALTDFSPPKPEVKTVKDDYKDLGKTAADTFIDTFDQETDRRGAFQKLTDRQGELKKSIQDLRVQNKDYTAELEEYQKVTEQVNAVQEIFKTKTEKTKKAVEGAQGSINILTEEVRKLTEELNKAEPGKVDEIAENLRKAQEELKKAQEEINDILNPDEALKKRLERDLKAEEESIDKRKNLRIQALLEQNLSAEDFAFQRGQIELEAERDLANAKAQIYKDDIAAKVQAETEASEKVKAIQEAEEERLRERTERIFNSISTAAEQIQLGIDGLGEFFEAKTENELAAIDDRYAREIELAEGNEERIAELEAERDAEKEKVEKKAFERQKKLQAATATISYLQGIVNILSSPSTIPDPFGAIFKGIQIGFLTGSYIANLAKIKAQRFAELGTLIDEKDFKGSMAYMKRGGLSMRPIELGKPQGGRYHSQGGNHAVVGGQLLEYERGEFADTDEFGNLAIINRTNTARHRKALARMAGKRYLGKQRDLAAINSYMGAGINFAQDGIQIPNIAGALSGSSGGSQQVFITTQTGFSDEQFARLEDTMLRATSTGTQSGVTTGLQDSNREAERQARLDDGLTV